MAETVTTAPLGVKKYPFWSKLWFTWLVLTAVYIAIFLFTDGLRPQWSTLVVIGSAIGMLVPVGPWTGTLGLIGLINSGEGFAHVNRPFAFLVAIFFIFCLFIFDRKTQKYHLSIANKIFLNLLALLIITLLFDLAFWGSWDSLIILQNGGFGSMSL